MMLRRGPVPLAPLSKRSCLSGGKWPSDVGASELLDSHLDSVVPSVWPELVPALLEELQAGWWISHNLKI